MAQRLSLKPDSSFFRKIVVGAVGARQVQAILDEFGHDVRELERGATETKLWKDVKRKRVRIPDLVCVKCGQRIECRAKTKTELSMSHSPTDAERAWDFGMVDRDWIAFPVCHPVTDENRSTGRLTGLSSYWRERNWICWQSMPYVNFFVAGEFRRRLHARSSTKSGDEGAETFITWPAVFSTIAGAVDAIDAARGRIKVRPPGGRLRSWRIADGCEAMVGPGENVSQGQIIVASVRPLEHTAITCGAGLNVKGLEGLLGSRERTQRFAGVKVARLRQEEAVRALIEEIASDSEEDVYVRLEAAGYLSSVGDGDTRALFEQFLTNADPQTRLEAVIALGDVATPEAVEILSDTLSDTANPFYLRSAAAWSLAQTRHQRACDELIQAFADVDQALRQDALECLVGTGVPG